MLTLAVFKSVGKQKMESIPVGKATIKKVWHLRKASYNGLIWQTDWSGKIVQLLFEKQFFKIITSLKFTI